MKTGASFVVEGAQPFHRSHSGGLERHIIAHHVGDVDALSNLVDVTALNQPRHRASLVSKRSGHRGFAGLCRTQSCSSLSNSAIAD